MKKIYFIALLAITLCRTNSFAQNVAINSSGAAPNSSAMLDISSTTSGLLIPRIALTARNAAAPVASPATSLLVYNTATAGTAPNDVYPGYYYWDGAKWVRKVDFIVERYQYPPTNINTGFGYNLVGIVPGCTSTTSAFVNLIGDWAVTPIVTIMQVEAMTGQVRFRVTNTSGTNYTGMDFVITVIR